MRKKRNARVVRESMKCKKMCSLLRRRRVSCQVSNVWCLHGLSGQHDASIKHGSLFFFRQDFSFQTFENDDNTFCWCLRKKMTKCRFFFFFMMRWREGKEGKMSKREGRTNHFLWNFFFFFLVFRQLLLRNKKKKKGKNSMINSRCYCLF